MRINEPNQNRQRAEIASAAFTHHLLVALLRRLDEGEGVFVPYEDIGEASLGYDIIDVPNPKGEKRGGHRFKVVKNG